MRIVRSVVAAAFALTLAVAGGSTASASSAGGLAGWTASGPGSAEVAKADKGARSMSYNYAQVGPEAGAWTMSKVAEESGPLALEWTIDGFHGFFRDAVRITVFADGPGGRSSQQVLNIPGFPDEGPGTIDGPFTFDGTAEVEITAGYAFGFIVEGSNFDCCSFLEGTLTVKERS